MRWIKKIVRAILALLPAFIISLLGMTSNSYATSHELNGIRWAYPVTTCGNSNWDDTQTPLFYYGCGDDQISFSISFSDPHDELLRPRYFSSGFVPGNFDYFSNYRMFSTWDTELQQCYINSSWEDADLQVIGFHNSFPTGSRYSIDYGFPYASSSVPDTVPSAKCTRLGFQYSPSLPFYQNSLSDTDLDLNAGSMSPRAFYRDKMDAYWYTSDGFYTHTKRISSSTGQVYNSAFYLSELLNGVIPSKFTSLNIPIYQSESNEDCTGSLSDRDVDFKGIFRFDEPTFQWNTDLGSNSLFVLTIDYLNGLGNTTFDNFTCTSNLQTVDGYQQLEFSCPGHVDNFSGEINARLVIRGSDTNGDPTWVWQSSNWSFGGLYIVTDNIDATGCSLNDDLTGTNIGGDHTNDPSSGGDFAGLTNLFNFTFINPFAPLFQLFTDSSSCAQIPTIAGMIHSEETQVCPWFDSTTRAIVTPILGISSMMLIFGFAVRWLSSSSGNMFEDQTSHKWGNTQFGQKGKH
jgi:hypothetical protein